MLPGSALFGLAFGALVPQLGLAWWVGPLASSTMFAGAAQIAIIEQLRVHSPAIIAVATALVINARFALYSTALAPLYAPFPRRWRFGLAFIMTDQAAVTALAHARAWADPVRRRWFVLGVSLPLVLLWVAGTFAGVLLGPVLPDAWQIGFIVPLMFIATMVPHLRSRPALVAVAVAVAGVVLLRELPYGLNVLVGALAGIGVGSLLPPPAVPASPEDVQAA